MKRALLSLTLILLALASTGPAHAWGLGGHVLLTRAAFQALPLELPAFFRDGADLAAHCSIDPDVQKNPLAPALRDRETPDHFMDYELLQGKELPHTRSGFIALCNTLKVEPGAVGYVPYSVAEGVGRLQVAFAEYRKWPENPSIRTKCLVYAGLLAHYAEDLCNPLHVTVHYNGRVGADGKSPHSGIHEKVDDLIEYLGFQPAELARDQQIAALPVLFAGILKEVDASRAQIDRAYELEAKLPAARPAEAVAPEVAAFGRERAREATRFTAALYLTAWQSSARVKLPEWLEREGGAAK